MKQSSILIFVGIMFILGVTIVARPAWFTFGFFEDLGRVRTGGIGLIIFAVIYPTVFLRIFGKK